MFRRGSFPQDHEYVAVQQALNFGVLDANPKWEPEADNLGWFTFTSDNSEMRLWEIRPDTDLVVFHSGSMVQLTTMGRGIEDEDFTVPALLELRMPFTTASPDEELVAAVYEVGLRVDSRFLHAGRRRWAPDQIPAARRASELPESLRPSSG